MNPVITTDQFVNVLEAAGIDAAQREKLHREFERQHPAAHEAFLVWLGISPEDRAHIRRHAAK